MYFIHQIASETANDIILIILNSLIEELNPRFELTLISIPDSIIVKKFSADQKEIILIQYAINNLFPWRILLILHF